MGCAAELNHLFTVLTPIVLDLAAAGNAPDMSERLARASMFGDDGLAKIEELEGMMNTLYTRACDTKQPTVWPSMPLRLGS